MHESRAAGRRLRLLWLDDGQVKHTAVHDPKKFIKENNIRVIHTEPYVPGELEWIHYHARRAA